LQSALMLVSLQLVGFRVQLPRGELPLAQDLAPNESLRLRATILPPRESRESHLIRVIARIISLRCPIGIRVKMQNAEVVIPIHSERHRALRHSFVAGIEVTEVQTEKHFVARTKDLSIFGCFVETATPFPENTKVRLRISHGGVNFVTQGKVAYSRPNSGMGIAFTSIEPSSLPVLDAWLADLRK